MSELNLYKSKIEEIRSYLQEASDIKISARMLVAIGLSLALFPMIIFIVKDLSMQLSNYAMMRYFEQPLLRKITSVIRPDATSSYFDVQVYTLGALILLLTYLAFSKLFKATNLIENQSSPISKKFLHFWGVNLLIIYFFGIALTLAKVELLSVVVLSIVVGAYFYVLGQFSHKLISYLGMFLVLSGLTSIVFENSIIQLSPWLLFYMPAAFFLASGMLLMIENFRKSRALAT